MNQNTTNSRHGLLSRYAGVATLAAVTKQFVSINNPARNQERIRKRHWLIGALLVVTSSWITHNTTANISGGITVSKASQISSRSLPFVTPSKVQSTLEQSPLQLLDAKSHHASPENDGVSTVNDILKFALSPPAETPLIEKTHTIRKGETLGIIFKRENIDLSLAHDISKHEIAKRLIKLSIGKDILFRYDSYGALKELNYAISPLQSLQIAVESSKVSEAKIVDLAYTTRQNSVSAEIHTNLYDAALGAGLSNQMIMEMVRIFRWDIDFVLDIKSGDSFHIIYTEHFLNDQKLADGNILAAEFNTQNHQHRAIRYQDQSGDASYYTPEGKSMVGAFLRSPVEFSRISSRFGKRRHPILKKTRAHKGVDYAASRGTPIRATANGKVLSAGRKGGYGKTVILKHAGSATTLYAHMSRYAKGIRSGAKVRQGQVIGYIGSTGLATGPHLHYEFRLNGVHKNPLKYKTKKTASIAKSELETFNKFSSQWVNELIKASNSYQLAKNTVLESGQAH